jgi:hypothetical protein
VLEDERDPAGFGQGLLPSHGVGEDAREVERPLLERRAAFQKTREVEEMIGQEEQRPRASLDGGEGLLRLAARRLPPHEVGPHDDRAERRAQLVGQLGEKGRGPARQGAAPHATSPRVTGAHATNAARRVPNAVVRRARRPAGTPRAAGATRGAIPGAPQNVAQTAL